MKTSICPLLVPRAFHVTHDMEQMSRVITEFFGSVGEVDRIQFVHDLRAIASPQIWVWFREGQGPALLIGRRLRFELIRTGLESRAHDNLMLDHRHAVTSFITDNGAEVVQAETWVTDDPVVGTGAYLYYTALLYTKEESDSD